MLVLATPLRTMLKKIPTLLLAAIAGLALMGCGEKSADDIRKTYTGLSDEKLQVEALEQRAQCRSATEDSDRPGAPCNRANIAEDVAESRGWCWGPYGAANSDKLWMRCSDDVTRTERAKAPWFAATQSGTCREAMLTEVIAKVLEHDGPRNVKTSFTPEGFFDVSSQLKDGSSYSVRLFPSCGAAKMVYSARAGTESGATVAAPLGMSPNDAGEMYGFDMHDCNVMSFSSGLGCGVLFQGGNAPIRLSDGFAPCLKDMPVQFNFQPSKGMVRVTCGVSAETQTLFEETMASIFGAPVKAPEGSRSWALGTTNVESVDEVRPGRGLRKVTVYQN